MSSSSVYQGLQSCLQPRLMESKSRFSHSISPISESKSHIVDNNTTTIIKTDNRNNDCDMKIEKTEDITSGWSFLQCLTNTNSTKERDDSNEKVYIHPLVKPASSKLSDQSLEMCTESLGSETGSNLVSDSESSDETISTISSSPQQITTGNIKITSNNLMREETDNLATRRRGCRAVSFPPPLTSIGGSSRFQVRPHREGGRLVLQAVTVSSSSPTCFHAERSGGRLRLCLVNHINPSPPSEDEEEEEFDEEDQDCCYDSEDVEGVNGEVIRDEIGIEKLQRPRSRCKEGGRGAGDNVIWEPFWVAT